MLLNPLEFHAPKTLSEAIDLCASLPNFRIQAGGTFLMNTLKALKRKGTKTTEHVVSLCNIKELKGITADDQQLTIGSMTTIDEIFSSPYLKDNFSILHTVCRNISTQPIRNMATMGGNLTCRYTWTEMPAAMIGLEAELHFPGKEVGREGREEREEVVSAEDFYKNGAKTGKILTAITIKRDKTVSLAYRRIKKTQFVDIPLLSLMIKTTFQGNRLTNTRVAINNCVNFAQRDSRLEEFLNQSSRKNGIAEEALDHLTDTIYDTRSSEYKKYMFRSCIKSAIQELVQQSQPSLKPSMNRS